MYDRSRCRLAQPARCRQLGEPVGALALLLFAGEAGVVRLHSSAWFSSELLFRSDGDAFLGPDSAAAALQRYIRAGFASYVAWHAPDMVRVALAAGRVELAQQVPQPAHDQLEPVERVRQAGRLIAG